MCHFQTVPADRWHLVLYRTGLLQSQPSLMSRLFRDDGCQVVKSRSSNSEVYHWKLICDGLASAHRSDLPVLCDAVKIRVPLLRTVLRTCTYLVASTKHQAPPPSTTNSPPTTSPTVSSPMIALSLHPFSSSSFYFSARVLASHSLYSASASASIQHPASSRAFENFCE